MLFLELQLQIKCLLEGELPPQRGRARLTVIDLLGAPVMFNSMYA